MRVIKNGRKRRLYFSAAERRAVIYAAQSSRCPQCGRYALWTTGARGGLNCGECSWYAVYGKDVRVTFGLLPVRGGHAVRVLSMTLRDGTAFAVKNYPVERILATYGHEVTL